MLPAAPAVIFAVAALIASTGIGLAAIAPDAASPAAPQVPAPDPASLLRDAEAASQRGDLIAAIQLYQSAIIFAPTNPVSYNALAQLHAANGQPELAEKYYGIVLDLDPANAPALKGLALLALANGDRAAAHARHQVLLRACGQTCPETGEVAQALGAATPN
jgi:Flp pilus assembly protein TadD